MTNFQQILDLSVRAQAHSNNDREMRKKAIYPISTILNSHILERQSHSCIYTGIISTVNSEHTMKLQMHFEFSSRLFLSCVFLCVHILFLAPPVTMERHTHTVNGEYAIILAFYRLENVTYNIIQNVFCDFRIFICSPQGGFYSLHSRKYSLLHLYYLFYSEIWCCCCHFFHPGSGLLFCLIELSSCHVHYFGSKYGAFLHTVYNTSTLETQTITKEEKEHEKQANTFAYAHHIIVYSTLFSNYM